MFLLFSWLNNHKWGTETKNPKISLGICASGWAWIQEGEIVRNLWKLQEAKIQIVTELRQNVLKS